jgi:uncharacterized protein
MTTDARVTIKDQLAAELRDAMKSGDKLRRDAIRQVQTEVTTVTRQAGMAEDTDEVYEVVIAAYVKKMAKARDEYLEMGERGAEMGAKLGFEVDYLSQWLPGKLGEAETRGLIRQTIEDMKVEGDPKAVGRVVGALMKTRSDLDGALVNRLAREELEA